MNIKNEVLYRVYFVLILIVLVALTIAVQTVRISLVEGPDLVARKDSLYVKYVPVNAPRGNIMAEGGALLTTSLPVFEVRFDLMTVDQEVFENNVDSLAYCLATFIDDSYTVGGYREMLLDKRALGERYLLVKNNASFSEVDLMSQFPIFRLGQFKGGFIVKSKHQRIRPFKQLAYRTIGYVKEGYNPVGLEGSFNDVLSGEEGKRLVFKTSGNNWIPVNNYATIEPKRGNDIQTNIDVNLQDIAHEALLKALKKHNAESGTAVIMEVKTGAIKAIANLGETENGWFEIYNYAVGSAYEPGSTFKLASVMALLEDGYVDLDDTIQLFKGSKMYYEEEMVDAVYHEYDSTTLQRAFEISSNVGISNLVNQYYGETKQAAKFIERLKEMNLHLPSNIEIKGEATPYIKEAYSDKDQWSGTTLPWMAIGYELTLTPMQIMTFYNAIANDGKMMKPFLVAEVQQFGKPIETYKPTVINRRIASPETIEKAQRLLKSVVDSGTAAELKTPIYDFAGKTGTAQLGYKLFKEKKGNLKYRASFFGYFPADDPVYTCGIVITDPKQNGRYGGEVAGPVFREIADRCYFYKVDFQEPVNQQPPVALSTKELPTLDVGYRPDVDQVLSYLELPFKPLTDGAWTVIKAENDTIRSFRRVIKDDVVPNVVGMGLRDAIYILENLGLKVEVTGAGKVRQQSIIPGTKTRGQTIRLRLG